MLDRRGDRPLYQQVADWLRIRIVAGDFPGGASLSSEAMLARQFDVSRDVIREALALLSAEGLVLTRRGRRAVVRERMVAASVALGGDAAVSARMPNADERRALALPGGVPLLVVRDNNGDRMFPADRVELQIRLSQLGCPST